MSAGPLQLDFVVGAEDGEQRAEAEAVTRLLLALSPAAELLVVGYGYGMTKQHPVEHPPVPRDLGGALSRPPTAH